MIEWNTFAVFVYKQYHFQLILNLSGSIKDYKMKDRLKIDMDHIVWVLKKNQKLRGTVNMNLEFKQIAS